MKILLVQLPVPNNALSNLPLGLGYLKASADTLNLPDIELTILERKVQDKGGDALLLKAILAHTPDIVGFALYTWNSSRTMHLARQLKAVAPELIILGGGPEVNYDSPFIVDETAFDWLIFGEGEQTFGELIKALHLRFTIYDLRLPGLYNRHAMPDSRHMTLRAGISDVNLIPSAYLSGALAGHEGRFMMLELSRWCPSKCTFCYYGRQDVPLGGKRYFEIERIKAELQHGLARGVEQVHFVEANFNTLPHLPQIYQTIKETGANRQMRFYAEMRGEAIDPEEADRLAECNFSTIEVGLQSAVPEVLARVRRKNHLPRLVRGVHLLRERGIEVFLDAILGLPGDTSETFRRTLDFMEQNDLAPYDLFHLQILSGTQLKTEVMAGQHGMVWQTEPPYFVLQTADLSFEQLCALRRETLERKGDNPNEVQGLPQPNPFALAQHKGHSYKPANLQATSASPDTSIERVIVDLTDSLDWQGLKETAQYLASVVTVWLKLGKLNDKALHLAAQILQILSAPNPSGVWHIFVESDYVLPEATLQRLYQAVAHTPGYLDRLAVFAMQESDPTKFPFMPSINLYNVYTGGTTPSVRPNQYIRRIELEPDATAYQWRATLEQALHSVEDGLYLCFPPDTNLTKIMAALEGLDFGDSTIWFEDWRIVAGISEDLSSINYPVTWRSGAITTLNNAELAKAALKWHLGARG